jgi:hypothetical protein
MESCCGFVGTSLANQTTVGKSELQGERIYLLVMGIGKICGGVEGVLVDTSVCFHMIWLDQAEGICMEMVLRVVLRVVLLLFTLFGGGVYVLNDNLIAWYYRNNAFNEPYGTKNLQQQTAFGV